MRDKHIPKLSLGHPAVIGSRFWYLRDSDSALEVALQEPLWDKFFLDKDSVFAETPVLREDYEEGEPGFLPTAAIQGVAFDAERKGSSGYSQFLTAGDPGTPSTVLAGLSVLRGGSGYVRLAKPCPCANCRATNSSARGVVWLTCLQPLRVQERMTAKLPWTERPTQTLSPTPRQLSDDEIRFGREQLTKKDKAEWVRCETLDPKRVGAEREKWCHDSCPEIYGDRMKLEQSYKALEGCYSSTIDCHNKYPVPVDAKGIRDLEEKEQSPPRSPAEETMRRKEINWVGEIGANILTPRELRVFLLCLRDETPAAISRQLRVSAPRVIALRESAIEKLCAARGVPYVRGILSRPRNAGGGRQAEFRQPNGKTPCRSTNDE